MLKHSRIHSAWSLDDLFGPGEWCPVCHGESFTHTEGAGIFCNTCEAEFKVRDTCGDPGCVIDCYPNPKGKYICINPGMSYRDEYEGARVKRFSPYVFWQIIKECEEGLDDRKRWCTQLEGYTLHYRQDDPVQFVEFFQFQPREAANHIMWDRFAKTPTARKLQALIDAAWVPLIGKDAPAIDVHARYAMVTYKDEDRPLWDALNVAQKAYHDAYDRYNKKGSKNWLGRSWDLGDELEKYAPRGFYYREQCQKVWDQDSFWLHICLPKQDEKPKITWPLYTRRHPEEEA